MKKRFLSLLMSILTITFTFIPTLEVFANEQPQITNNYQYINEYDMYCDLKEKSEKELLVYGYSKEEVQAIRDFNYEEAVRQRAKLPTETLIKYGYTKEEIIELKELEKLETIPSSTLKAISRGTLGSSIRVTKKGKLVEGGKTVNYVDLKYSFKWKRVPVFTLTDLVVIAFNSSNSNKFIYKIVSDNTHKLTANLTNLITGEKLKANASWKFDTKSAQAVSAKFAIGLKDSSGNLTHMCWNGSGTIRLTNASSKSRLYIDACYGHTTINLVPNFSINLSGVSIGVSLRKGMDSRHDTGYYYSNFTIDDSYVYEGVVLGL